MYDSSRSEFRLWFTCGWMQEPGICYATSQDGVRWNRFNDASHPSIRNLYHAFVFLDDRTRMYYAYGVEPFAPGAGFDRYHSSDGVVWTLDAKGLLASTGKGWDAQWNGNSFVWIEGSTWYILYEMFSGTVWQIGEATSSDGLTWKQYESNPVLTYPGSGCGGPEMHKIGTTYYVWATCAVRGFLPTNIYRFSSTDLHTWTRVDGNAAGAVLSRTTTDEGSESGVGQVADPSIVEVNGSIYMMYGATDTQDPQPDDAMHLKLAVVPLTLAQVVETGEGDGPDSLGAIPTTLF